MINLNMQVVELAKIVGKTHQSIHKFCNKNKIDILVKNKKAYLTPQSVRKYFEKFNFKYPDKIASFQACKGGVGKTSLCFNVALRAAQYGAKILLVDLDMQAHLTMALMKPKDNNFHVWHDILCGRPIEEVVIKFNKSIDIIPSSLDNSHIDKKISQSTKIIYSSYVKDKLLCIKEHYDLILIDCSPALSHINTAITIASDEILIPVNPDIFSFDGLEKTLVEINDIQKSFNTDSDISIVLNRFDAREKNSLDIIVQLKNKYSSILSPTVVVVSSEIKNCIANNQFIFNLQKRPPILNDIDSISQKILGLSESLNG